MLKQTWAAIRFVVGALFCITLLPVILYVNIWVECVRSLKGRGRR